MGYPSSLLRLWFNMSTSKKGSIFLRKFWSSNFQASICKGYLSFKWGIWETLTVQRLEEIEPEWKIELQGILQEKARHTIAPHRKNTHPVFLEDALCFANLSHIWVIWWQIFIGFHPSTTTLTKHAQVASRFRKHWELVALDRSGEARRYRIACTKGSVVITCYNSRCGLFERKPGRNRWLRNWLGSPSVSTTYFSFDHVGLLTMIETVPFWNHGHVRSGIDKECENAPWHRVDCSVEGKPEVGNGGVRCPERSSGDSGYQVWG